ncbi:MAG: hypothetical protein SXU28_11045 [Pseudomonadota bacterium]|nr:hypothetical protein [Pseudomonadota bacterium]
MKSTMKVWTGLGVATALAGAGLAGCAGESGESGESGTEATEAGEAGEGESGEGESGEGEAGSGEAGEGKGGEGEGGEGEGGVDVSDAATDPVVYGSALAIVEAHAIAARDAYAAGKTEEAAEMFGHPVSEVLSDMSPVFQQVGVEDFSASLNEASAAALKADNGVVVGQRYDAVVAALRAAEAKAPTGDASDGAIAAGVVADQIDRAVDMYSAAAGSDIYQPYLDGYGFYKAAASAFSRNGDAIKTYNSGLHADISAALGLLAQAYPSAERPAALEIDKAKLLGAASKVELGLPSA